MPRVRVELMTPKMSRSKKERKEVSCAVCAVLSTYVSPLATVSEVLPPALVSQTRDTPESVHPKRRCRKHSSSAVLVAGKGIFVTYKFPK
jgi:hypothetical protein